MIQIPIKQHYRKLITMSYKDYIVFNRFFIKKYAFSQITLHNLDGSYSYIMSKAHSTTSIEFNQHINTAYSLIMNYTKDRKEKHTEIEKYVCKLIELISIRNELFS